MSILEGFGIFFGGKRRRRNFWGYFDVRRQRFGSILFLERLLRINHIPDVSKSSKIMRMLGGAMSDPMLFKGST